MLVVGLTGGIATGKSVAAKMFQELGAQVIDADQIARQLLGPDQPTWQKVVDYFGPRVLQADGQIKRKYLADQIYSDDAKRWALNNIVHPPVVVEIDRQLKAMAEAQPQALVVVDVPLLFEVEWPFAWDSIIVVVANQEQQYERLRNRDDSKLSRLKFQLRLRSQLSLEEKARRADWVIYNTISLENTKEQVKEIFHQLQKGAATQDDESFDLDDILS